ncbi:MAG: glycosyltransferase family protein, partial [Candidatus Brocadiae bacterium]|nr:glycosyltransferase family protein [Candidatus Brocadiia bacterium]
MTELQALRAEAESLYEKGDLQGSLSKYRSLLGDDGDDPGLLNDIGTVCFALGRVEESARYYVSALELDEGCGEARQNLQRLCKAIGKTVDAVVHSARQQPGSSGRLEALLQQGRYSEAYELACRCTEREPDNAEAWNDAAVVAHELRKTAEAVGYIQQAVELAPRDLDIQQNLRRIEQAATERRDSFSLPGGSSRIVCGVQDRPIRVLFLEHGTPAAFLRNLLRAFEREDWLQTHYVRVGPKTDSVPFGWADVIWVEWASHLARHVTNSVAALREKKVVCRLHRYEAFGDIPHFINWDVVDRLVFVAEHIRETFSQRFPEVCVPQTVIHNGVDLDRFEVATGKRQARDVAFLAHLDYRKNLPLMLQIARELKERGTGRRIHVGGDWRAPEVREY